MAKKVRFGSRHIHLPGSRILRVVIGVLLVIGGILGFLPILGFWMIPLGLLILSVDIPVVRRWRRQLTVWWHRRKEERAEARQARFAAKAAAHSRETTPSRSKTTAETR